MYISYKSRNVSERLRLLSFPVLIWPPPQHLHSCLLHDQQGLVIAKTFILFYFIPTLTAGPLSGTLYGKSVKGGKNLPNKVERGVLWYFYTGKTSNKTLSKFQFLYRKGKCIKTHTHFLYYPKDFYITTVS